MDWKNKFAGYREKARKLWASAKEACVKAWTVCREGCGKGWSKCRAVGGKVWEKTRVFTADARVWLGKAWNVVNIWLTRAKVWLQKAFAFLKEHSKHLLGWMAVLALKTRKWARKSSARLRGWWAHWKGREWLEDKTQKLRNRLPKPAEAEPPQITEGEPEAEAAEEPIPAPVPTPVPESVPVQTHPVRSAPRRRKLGPVATTLLAVWKGFSGACVWIYRKRKYIMAAPVAFFAVKLALANANRLPDMVGLDIQASGEFARMVSRQQAVWGPLGVTAFCLVLVLCSRKPLLPWLISMFTLILPVLIWMTNYYA